MWKSLAFLLLILCLMGIPHEALADTPTPSPTPVVLTTPIPLPTNEYSNLKTTPTPFSITPVAMPLDTSGKASQFADTTINVYNFINFGHVMDWITLTLLLFFVVRALFGLINKIRGQ